jgi:hypothetical protein
MDNWELAAFAARLAVVCFVGYVVYHFLFRKSAEFTIQVRSGQCNCEGRVPLTQQNAIAQFLIEDLGLKEPVKIQGAWDHKRLRLWFRGRIGEGEKQRIRNFLLGRL